MPVAPKAHIFTLYQLPRRDARACAIAARSTWPGMLVTEN